MVWERVSKGGFLGVPHGPGFLSLEGSCLHLLGTAGPWNLFYLVCHQWFLVTHHMLSSHRPVVTQKAAASCRKSCAFAHGSSSAQSSLFSKAERAILSRAEPSAAPFTSLPDARGASPPRAYRRGPREGECVCPAAGGLRAGLSSLPGHRREQLSGLTLSR